MDFEAECSLDMSQRSNYSLEEAMLIPKSLCRGENTTQDSCGALTKTNTRTLVADLLTCAGADHVIVSLLSSVPTNGTGTKIFLLEGALSTAGKKFSAIIFSESANRSSHILAFRLRGLSAGACRTGSPRKLDSNTPGIPSFLRDIQLRVEMLTLKS